MMNIDYPFHFDGRSRTADTTGDDHVQDLIEQVLFTVPGTLNPEPKKSLEINIPGPPAPQIPEKRPE